MNPIRRAALALSLVVFASAAMAATTGSGKPATEARNVAAFQAVATQGSIDLLVRQGATAVQVQADDNLLPLLETVVENDGQGPTLVVRWKRGERIQTHAPVRVTVTTPKLTALASGGSGEIRVEALDTPSLKVSLSGSGNVRFDQLSAGELTVSIAGSANLDAKGKATRVNLRIAGSGNARLAELQSDEVRVSVAGSGDAQVLANRTLDVSIAGSGDVTYAGNPAVTRSVAGSGTVRRR